MRYLFLGIATLCLIAPASVALAQTPMTHPTDSSAVLLAVDTVAWSLPSVVDPPTLATSNEGKTRQIVCVWRTPTGRTDYVIAAETFEAGDSCAALDSLSTPELFNRLAYVAVLHGAAAGYADSAADSVSPGHSWVFFAACVERTGAGSSTTLSPCSDSLRRCIATYYGTEPAIITLHYSGGSPACSVTDCESTAPGDGAGALE
ncbi:MAG TPA: hypothetical protein VNA88_09620 [Candidatus Kapabacteria bacterium]|jgi:hypothetical protein|nr:hypothetical protein [Candidatus Kapabacteria bacterium]